MGDIKLKKNEFILQCVQMHSSLENAEKAWSDYCMKKAAPLLLEACESALNDFDDLKQDSLCESGYWEQPESIKLIRKAIKVANGEDDE